MKTLKVQLLSAKDGRPLAERQIKILISRILYAPDKSDPRMFLGTEYTDGDGIATFQVNIDLPPKSGIGIYGLKDYCSPGDYDAIEVLHNGFANKRKCPHRPMEKFKVSARPGEIVIFSGEYTRLERTSYFPWAS